MSRTVQDTATISWNNSTTGQSSASVVDDSITNAKLAEVSTQTIKGRSTAGTGNPEDISTSAALDFISSTPDTILYRGVSAWSIVTIGSSLVLSSGVLNAASIEPVTVSGASHAVVAKTKAISIQRAAPSSTAISLPTVAAQDGVPLKIIDWSTSVTAHTITITPSGSEKIMQSATWELYSNSASLASVTLYPSTTLSGWYIAP